MRFFLYGILMVIVGALFWWGSVRMNDLSGVWQYHATLDDGTTLEGETTASQTRQGNRVLVAIADQHGEWKDGQIRIDTRKTSDGIQYQATGALKPLDVLKRKWSGALQVQEVHPTGEQVTTRVELQVWR